MVTLLRKNQKHTTGGIPRWSPTLVLVVRFSAYVWQSGRDAQFSLTYGRMYQMLSISLYDTRVVSAASRHTSVSSMTFQAHACFDWVFWRGSVRKRRRRSSACTIVGKSVLHGCPGEENRRHADEQGKCYGRQHQHAVSEPRFWSSVERMSAVEEVM
jgi:hypothetical protein